MSGHTPGPWEFDPDNYGVPCSAGYGLLDSDGHSLGVFVEAFGVLRRKYPNAEANARLIAAAPDLLHCLSRIIDELPSHRDWLDPSLEAHARTVISKATGETP